MQTISTEHSVLHSLAISLCSTHRRVEAEIIAALQEIDRCKLYKKPGQPSLFSYAVNLLSLSESVSYAFIAVARAAIEFPELNLAIKKQKLSVAKAKRIVSVLKPENVACKRARGQMLSLQYVNITSIEGILCAKPNVPLGKTSP
jgi:hypothetical protein